MEDTASIYRIVHTESGCCYVGHTTKRLAARFSAHKKMLRASRHHGKRLQRTWLKYGEVAFAFELLETCPSEQKLAREQHYIDTLDSAFNTARVAGSRLGVPQPPSEVSRLRSVMLGNKLSSGRKQADDEKQRRSDALKGREVPLETRARISAGSRGKSRGVGHQVSEQTRAKISAANQGRALSPESQAKATAGIRRAAATTSAKLRSNPPMSMVGKQHSKDAKSRISATNKATTARKRSDGSLAAAGQKIAEGKRRANSLRRQFWLIFGPA